MSDQTPTTEDIHSDSFVTPRGLPADAEPFLSECGGVPDFTDEQLIEMEFQDSEYRRRQSLRKVATGRVAAVAAILSLF